MILYLMFQLPLISLVQFRSLHEAVLLIADTVQALLGLNQVLLHLKPPLSGSLKLGSQLYHLYVDGLSLTRTT